MTEPGSKISVSGGGGGWVALALLVVLFRDFSDKGDLYDAIMRALLR